jgi:glyoxylase-like metal-dependent hydrolase (beta-lactamase superfamily II)
LIDRISDNFYCITLPMPFRLKHVHIYVLVSGERIALFDSGLNNTSCYKMVEKDLESIGLGIKSIRDIYLTHVHTDHCGMAGRIQNESGAGIHLSLAAYTFYKHSRKRDLWKLQANQFYSRHGMSPQEIEAVMSVFSYISAIVAEFRPADYLQPNEVRELGDCKFEVIFTPGHALGHVCFFFRKEGFLISGDHVLPQITPNLSPDIFDPDSRPLKTFLDSLQTVERLPVEKIYPGHGIFFTDLKTRLKELRAHHKERTELILNCLNTKPKTTLQVSQDIFGIDLPDFDKFLALNETYVHLVELKLEGLIDEDKTCNVIVYAARRRTAG